MEEVQVGQGQAGADSSEGGLAKWEVVTNLENVWQSTVPASGRGGPESQPHHFLAESKNHSELPAPP